MTSNEKRFNDGYLQGLKDAKAGCKQRHFYCFWDLVWARGYDQAVATRRAWLA
jgi:hypothetical protein